MTKVYYRKNRQAPYLQSDDAQDAASRERDAPQASSQEADAAAGAFHQRVSSFSLLPRTTSADTVATLNKQSSAAALDKTAAAATEPKEKEESPEPQPIKPDWRLKDRMKTVGVGLVMALNVGTDPPDVTKPYPCATLQCWMDPRSVSRAKAKELIGERLEQQYAKWQLARTARPLKYRKALDPTVEDVRNLCAQLRRQARNERVLLHYNGHGVPRPTGNGELWVFDKGHTEYIPLSCVDLRQWLGKPSIVVLDCSSAGILIPYFTAPLSDGSSTPPASPARTSSEHVDMDVQASQWVNDTIVLCPCSENEWLPMQPDYPADIFTSCLTTPIKMALRWFVRRNPNSMSHLHPDAVDAIPGKATDRKTPLGELNWIFTAVTDSIAWNILPKPLFQRLFRQDLLVASMFRNFLLADRILRSLGCTPVSYPPLPPGVSDHPLWEAWDLACETLLFQLMKDGILGNHVLASPKSQDGEDEETATAPSSPPPVPTPANNNAASSISSPFFSEQLTAFEVWLEFASIHKMRLASGTLESPEHLPVVLQVLLSQVHRIRALRLLRQFLDLGPWAVNLSLSLGIFPYVMKLLQSPEYKSLLVSIWASILSFDPSCRVELLKDGALHHFVQHLTWGLNSGVKDVAAAAKEQTLAAFVLAAACHEYPAGQSECVSLGLQGSCYALLSSYEQGENAHDDAVELHLPSHFRLWVCLCLANSVKENTPTQNEAYSSGIHSRLKSRLNDKSSDVRAAACYALGCLIGTAPKARSRVSSAQDLASLAQQGSPFLSPRGLVPQRLSTPGNVMISGGAQGAATGPGQLQPSFVSPQGVPNIQWRPQHLDSLQQLPTQPLQVAQDQQVPMQGQQFSAQGQHISMLGQFTGQAQQFPGQGQQFLTQQNILRSQGQPIQPQYIMQGQPMQHSPNLGGSIGFLISGGPAVGQGQPQLLVPSQFQHQVPRDSRQVKAPVFEDRHRLELDVSSMEALLEATQDASVVVRYEATIALAAAVDKYLDAFIAIAEDASSTQTSSSSLPQGLDSSFAERFRSAWKVFRSLQHEDPFPAILKAANEVVSFVHGRLLRDRLESDSQSDLKGDLSRLLVGIEEEFDSDMKDAGLHHTPASKKIPLTPQTVRKEQRKLPKAEMRRVASETVAGKSGIGSMEQSALLADTSFRGVSSGGRLDLGPIDFCLPTSKYYEWKKNTFDVNFKSTDDEEHIDPDPLSPEGAARVYMDHRNFVVRESSRRRSERYASLAPKPPTPKKKSIEMLLEEESEEVLLAAEEEATAKKNELELSEKTLLRNEGVRMTSMVSFHPFEDVLMACGATDSVSMFDTESGKKLKDFVNGNREPSRLTTSTWINEETSSLFLVGCDDGSVRIWGNMLESNGEVCSGPPSMVSSFYAAPMKAGERGSGLICEWQQYSGTLLAGGNSSYIHCWDLEAEKMTNQLGTETKANVTSLTTAWDFDQLGMGPVPSGYQGIGRDIVVSGHSDGSLKVFDIRTNNVANEMRGQASSRVRRLRPTRFTEHKSWVVNTAFTSYGSRYELISGTLAGDIKAWDLRMSSSIRTVEAQRSTMTTFSVHRSIPMVATGSHAQFIKLLTLDGDTISIVRYHEKMASHRIGPVSCLAFHPYKPLLAAGATDTFIGLYKTKKDS